jgi:hypothetical protein
MKTTDYMVLCISDFRELGKQVKKKIDEGWQPLGGLVALSIILPPPTGGVMMAPKILREFYQSMVKVE